MSSFLSNKFLKYRNPQTQKAQRIDADRFCIGCGYNLRGLTTDKLCPECGQSIAESSGITDLLLAGSTSELRGMRLGLTLVAMSVLVAAIARFGIFLNLVFIRADVANDAYLWLGLMLSMAMLIGGCLVTPRRLDSRYPSLRWLRISARWLLALWVIGYACWLLARLPANFGTGLDDTFMSWSAVCRALACVGVLLLTIWLLRLAVDAELDDAARRINLAAFMLPVPTLLLAFVPDEVYWITLLVIVPVLLIWCWFLLVLGRGFLQMQRHVSWSLRIADQNREKMNRMEQKRRSIDQQVAANVRPTPRIQGDISMTGRDE